MLRLTRDQKIALCSLAVSAIGVVVTLAGIPEFRRALFTRALSRIKGIPSPALVLTINASGALGATLIIITAGSAGYAVARLRRLSGGPTDIESAALRDVMNFHGSELIFVVGPRVKAAGSIMPGVAVEDVFAMMNVIWLMVRNGMKPAFKLRDVAHLSETDHDKLIVTIGGPRANAFTYAALEPVGALFDEDRSTHRWILKFAEAQYDVHNDSQDDAAADAARRDVGVIAKVPNPYRHGKSVIVLAGTRGIGTWGVADHLRKEIVDLHANKRGDGNFHKRGHFVAVVNVEYEDYDVVATDVLTFRDLS